MWPYSATVGTSGNWGKRWAVSVAMPRNRPLLGAIKALDLNVSTASGGLAVELPYRLFEFFQPVSYTHLTLPTKRIV